MINTPRKAREKSDKAVYHVICRSISELVLFKDDSDKNYYLHLLKKYTERYKCSIYAYCLMDNHIHLHIDPKGFDISKFMLSLNTAFVIYYNRKYSRHGHVFQDRFVSRILSLEKDNLIVSAYIHNNPRDLNEFNGKEEFYRYSSYGIYLGLRRDSFKLIDKSFIKSFFNLHNKVLFAQRYKEFVSHQSSIDSLKDKGEGIKQLPEVMENEYISGRRVIIRDYTPSKIIALISEKMSVSSNFELYVKAKRGVIQYRSFVACVLRTLCGLGYKEICNHIYNITVSGCSRLCNKGYELLARDTHYKSMYNQLISCRI